jgi:hypothetical protein
MDSGAGFFIVCGIAFLAWLMASGKASKETFLSYAWIGMLLVGAANMLYLLLS